ncbi:MAG: nickel pincer cofactor biosynthesis protein LarB [Planctomycetota bacterium]|jgi:NCAIR mutase (PurE)-related protein
MDRKTLMHLLEAVRDGGCSIEDAVESLARLPMAAGATTLADTHREVRTGVPEVIFAKGKTPKQCADAALALSSSHDRVLLTHADSADFEAVAEVLPGAVFDAEAGCITWFESTQPAPLGNVLVVCAGTSDLSVAAEARCTATWLGCETDLLVDVGVAGIHRLLHHLERLRTADALVVVAGMEGALPSVIAGMVSAPVIAVPTSVGYGASFQGLTALLSMLNSCSPGIGVVNIDNGFGGAVLAAKIAKSAHPLH